MYFNFSNYIIRFSHSQTVRQNNMRSNWKSLKNISIKSSSSSSSSSSTFSVTPSFPVCIVSSSLVHFSTYYYVTMKHHHIRKRSQRRISWWGGNWKTRKTEWETERDEEGSQKPTLTSNVLSTGVSSRRWTGKDEGRREEQTGVGEWRRREVESWREE